MTKQTKIIIGLIGGLVLIGGFIIIAAAAVIGLSVMAAQSEETTGKTKSTKSVVMRDKNSNTKQPDKSADNEEKNKDRRKAKDDAEEDEDEGNGAVNLSGSVAPEVVGKWMWSEGSRQVDGTGKTQYGGGAWHTYEFMADGSVKYTMEKDLLTIMQCQINESKTAVGTAASSGDSITVNLGEMSDTGTSSCGGGDNFDKTLPATTIGFKYKPAAEDSEATICTEDQNGGEQCYQKSKD